MLNEIFNATNGIVLALAVLFFFNQFADWKMSDDTRRRKHALKYMEMLRRLNASLDSKKLDKELNGLIKKEEVQLLVDKIAELQKSQYKVTLQSRIKDFVRDTIHEDLMK